MKHVNIPTRWTGTEALGVVAFLERIIEAVWRQHGEQMADQLYTAAAERSAPDRLPLCRRPPTSIDDDLPL